MNYEELEDLYYHKEIYGINDESKLNEIRDFILSDSKAKSEHYYGLGLYIELKLGHFGDCSKLLDNKFFNEERWVDRTESNVNKVFLAKVFGFEGDSNSLSSSYNGYEEYLNSKSSTPVDEYELVDSLRSFFIENEMTVDSDNWFELYSLNESEEYINYFNTIREHGCYTKEKPSREKAFELVKSDILKKINDKCPATRELLIESGFHAYSSLMSKYGNYISIDSNDLLLDDSFQSQIMHFCMNDKSKAMPLSISYDCENNRIIAYDRLTEDKEDNYVFSMDFDANLSYWDVYKEFPNNALNAYARKLAIKMSKRAYEIFGNDSIITGSKVIDRSGDMLKKASFESVVNGTRLSFTAPIKGTDGRVRGWEYEKAFSYKTSDIDSINQVFKDQLDVLEEVYFEAFSDDVKAYTYDFALKEYTSIIADNLGYKESSKFKKALKEAKEEIKAEEEYDSLSNDIINTIAKLKAKHKVESPETVYRRRNR
jgi:hypothetical protein